MHFIFENTIIYFAIGSTVNKIHSFEANPAQEISLRNKMFKTDRSKTKKGSLVQLK